MQGTKLINSAKVSQRLDQEDVTSIHTPTNGGIQQLTFVTEPGMYTVILRSDSPLAKPMQKWVTSEVLPSIRKTGGYIVAIPEDTPEIVMARGLLAAKAAIDKLESQKKVLEDKNQLLELICEENKPKVVLCQS